LIKTVGIFSLPPGTDPDAFWKYHTEVHAADVKKAAGPGLKKYTISRVTQVKGGDLRFFGMVEMWWENKEEMDGYWARQAKVKNAAGLTPLEDFRPRVIGSSNFIVEEKEIAL
jgi:uncharacterized protein (TIGR02118 family)